MLEKEHPKDFRSVDLEVLGSNLVISDNHDDGESCHSTPSILSLGVYSKDKRYFGYIITEVSSGKKERTLCYVYRASRNNTAAKIIDSISNSYQAAYAPQTENNNVDTNLIYSSSELSLSSNRLGSLHRINKSLSTSNSKSNLQDFNPPTELWNSTSHTSINPIYSRFLQPNTNVEANRRHSLASTISSCTNSQQNSVNSSPADSPAVKKKKNTNSLLSSRIFSNRKSMPDTGKVLSSTMMNLEKEKERLLGEGSTETLLTLTPDTNSNESSPCVSPILKKERHKSLPLLDLYIDGERINDSERIDYGELKKVCAML